MSKRLWTAAEASEKSGAQGVRERVAAAIREGVPLYNGGDAAGCARVYGLAAQELLGAVGPGGQATLRRALEADGGADARAWALRRALDSVADGGGPGLLRDFVALQGLPMATFVVNDTVMGGRSDSSVTQGVFRGSVTKRGGGGFASARFQPQERRMF